MKFHPNDISDAYQAEKAVWQKLKSAFIDEQGEAFHCYQLFDKYGNLQREIDILIVHRQLGLWVIECKGCYINNIQTINGAEWKMKNWYEHWIKPVNQAQAQMFALKSHLRQQLEFCNSLYFNFRVALPFISHEQWQNKGFANFPNTQGVVLIAEDFKPYTLKHKFTQSVQSRQRNLNDEQWQSLMRVFGITNQTPVDKVSFSISKERYIEKEKTQKTDDSENRSPACKIIKLPRQNFPDNNFPIICVHQNYANNLLESIFQPDLEIINQPDFEELENLLIEEEDDLLLVDDDEIDEFLEPQSDEDDAKSGKAAKSRRRTQSKKKHYTEDSIRLYLQEIGRIRLLRADEEIELARKVADLLELERIREKLSEQLDRDPRDSEWAEAVQVPLPAFRYRLHVGRRAKDKMVQSNLRLVVSIAKKYMNRGLSFQDLIQEGSLGLIRAAEKFDHEKGYKFSTYATWWIRQAITHGIADQSRTIRLPVHLYETISRIKKTTKLLSQEIGRKPTEEEIATRMEMTVQMLWFIAKSAQLPISLETPIGREEDSRLGDFIESDGETPEDQVSKNLLREDLEKVLNEALAYFYRGFIRSNLGEMQEAIGNYNQALKINPGFAEAYFHRGIALFCLKDLHRAIEDYNYTLRIYPDIAEVYSRRGFAHYSLGNYQAALEDYSQALKINSENAITYYYRGLVYETLSDYVKALEDYNQVLEINPEFTETYYKRGSIHYNLGNYQQALEDLNKLLRINPHNSQAYNKRSSIRSALKDYQGAMEDLQNASKLNHI
ncbi:RNA polymerase sigma factor RpoD [Nostoc sp. LEGE 06077]|nr:RNA polymerase sigma factor RpoD [Nostoc sp. LEGE 06077]